MNIRPIIISKRKKQKYIWMESFRLASSQSNPRKHELVAAAKEDWGVEISMHTEWELGGIIMYVTTVTSYSHQTGLRKER